MMTLIDYNFAFIDSVIKAMLTMLGANSRNSIFSFLTSAIVTVIIIRVVFHGKHDN